MAMCAVGALNVGSININFEPNFNTNIEEPTIEGNNFGLNHISSIFNDKSIEK